MSEVLQSTGMYLPEIAIMRGISLELETTESRMKDKHQLGKQGKIKRDAWFDEFRTRKHEATCYAMTVEEKHVDYIDDMHTVMKKIDETSLELWNLVGFRSDAERSGKVHWSIAHRRPRGTTVTASRRKSGEDVETEKPNIPSVKFLDDVVAASFPV